ncbi:glycosyltransferase family 2 protein [Pseudoprimorskyibacter insulae]|uniref:Putative glycosyltransferase EpsJ n=1 Tax=Pseudoprimorskyibacter insulae TaxID=1695997 RepID=A0A2R8B0I7_9RHOB|nr:glycosyltransferase family A protein [Pseudoprimorskyibacter insulae]SPF81792.1 putative glycosyltransferase EpsJ [Pseudoprimorskyibacter insulae]
MDDLITKLHASGLFDRDWYCATYADVAQTGLDPMWHFVKYGLDLGRAPGPGFDPGFYLARYPDVASGDITPLRHYLFHGQAEGRFPTPAAAQTHDGMTRVRRLQAELWGGLEDSAATGLMDLVNTPDLPDQVRFEAGCQLAFWRDYSGDAAGAEALLHRLGGLPPRYSRASFRQIPLATLYARRGARQAARAALQAILPEDQGSDQVLALANLENDAGKLDLINGLYAPRGLAQLTRRDAAALLSLGNLTATGCPARPAEGPLVSVIMPVFRAARTIRAAIASLQAQTHTDLEIIVVDDASDDDTFQIVSDLAKEDPRIRPIRQAVNGGAYAARNRGLSEARGEIITTHDADDWSHPQKIALQLDALAQDSGLVGVIAHWARVAPPFQITTNWRLGPSLLQWSHSSFLFHRIVADRLGGWDEVRVSGDMDYIWRCEAAFGAASVRRILPDLPLAFALDDTSSLTRNPLTHIQTSYRGLRHYYREICRFWQHEAPGGLTPDQQAEKRAMLPPAMLPGQSGTQQVDLLLRGDFCDRAVIAQMARQIEAAPSQTIALSHVPDPDLTQRQTGYAMQFDMGLFALLRRGTVSIACPEKATEASETLTLRGRDLAADHRAEAAQAHPPQP